MAKISEDDRLVLIGGLRRLRRQHRYVEDCWYSCPKAPEGCCDDAQGDECNCGADRHNALVDELLAVLGTSGEGESEGEPVSVSRYPQAVNDQSNHAATGAGARLAARAASHAPQLSVVTDPSSVPASTQRETQP